MTCTDSAGFGGSNIQFDYAVDRGMSIIARDGTCLSSDIYRPAMRGRAVDGKWPVILERTPYDKTRASHSITGRYFARRGYIAVMQDTRGRWASEGVFDFLRNEAEDGFDTVEWIYEQAWCNGKIGTLGLSYTTADQQALAIMRPRGLATQILFDGGYNYHAQTMRHAGACEYGVILQYGLWMARLSQEARRDAQVRSALDDMWFNLNDWMRRLPLRPGASPLALVPRYERWFFDMLTRADYDEFWKNPGLNLEPYLDQYPDIPLYLETSWYGHHITATLTKYAEFRRRNKSFLKMMMGSWLHSPDTFSHSYSGDVDFGAEAALESLNDVRLRWMDQYLKGLDTGIEDEPCVNLFTMGGGTGRKNAQGRLDHGGRWRFETEWPPASTTSAAYYLHSDGSLSTSEPASDAVPSGYMFNPADPVPTVGGNFNTLGTPGFPEPGGHDQREPKRSRGIPALPLAARRDVLVFRTPPLEANVEVTGPIVVRLWVASSAIDTDFTAKLIDEYPPNEDYPEGYALNITDSITRMRYRNSRERAEFMSPGRVYEVEISPQATSNLFAAGHRIRIDISSSNFPHYDVNPNTGEPLGLDRRIVVAHQTVFHDKLRPSHILLPVVLPGPTQSS